MVDIGLLLLGLVMLFFGAEGLVRGSSALALRLGLSPLVVGLTVVALGTSAPEMVVSVKATLEGTGDVALGNIVGSNLCNIGLIIGIGALISPLHVHGQVIRQEVPILLVASGVMMFFLKDYEVKQWEGGILLASIFGYILYSVIQAKRGKNEETAKQLAEELPEIKGSLWRDVLFVLAGLGILIAGGNWLVEGSVNLAREAGVSEAMIALTIVAIGTSLPELATTVVAARKGEGDIAVGNAIGSCIFNALAVLGLAASVKTVVMEHVDWWDLGAMMVMAIICLPIMKSRNLVSRTEGAVFVAIYLGYLGWTVFKSLEAA